MPQRFRNRLPAGEPRRDEGLEAPALGGRTARRPGDRAKAPPARR